VGIFLTIVLMIFAVIPARADTTFVSRGANGPRGVGFLPQGSSGSSKLQVWGFTDPRLRYPLGGLGLAWECLFEERVKAAGFLSSGDTESKRPLSPAGRVQAALGSNLYAKYPWDFFAQSIGMSKDFVWEKSLENGQEIFDSRRIYASVSDVLVLASQLSGSVCMRDLERTEGVHVFQDDLGTFAVADEGAFVAWTKRGTWVGFGMGRAWTWDPHAVVAEFSKAASESP
ncbi:MAG: hypothetical protein ABIR96_00815, partial [Bdellovibrionota bacterium]